MSKAGSRARISLTVLAISDSTEKFSVMSCTARSFLRVDEHQSAADHFISLLPFRLTCLQGLCTLAAYTPPCSARNTGSSLAHHVAHSISMPTVMQYLSSNLSRRSCVRNHERCIKG